MIWLYVALIAFIAMCAAAMLMLAVGQVGKQADELMERAIEERREREAVERRRRLSVAKLADPDMWAPDDWKDVPRGGGA